MVHNVRDWVVDRFALQPIHDGLLNRRVPKAPWYVGDGATLMSLLGIQVLTGAVLMLTYSPAVDSAHASVTYITDEQTLGWFVRGIHYWAAGAMMVVLFFHLFRQLLFAGYKSPREGTWIIGVLSFSCLLVMAYTGYLLRWDERAVHAIRVMLHMVVRVPGIGESLVLLVQGGPDIGPLTLTRIYAFHVFIVPLTTFALLGFHLYLVVQQGTITRTERRRPPESVEQQRQFYHDEANSENGEVFFPYTTLKTGMMAAVVIGAVLVATLVVGPAELMSEANLVESSRPAEEWWFWWYSGLIALLPPAVAPWFVVVFPIAAFLGLILLPFLDRGPARGVRQRPVWAVVVVLLVVALLALSDYRRRSSFTGWPDPDPPQIPVGLELTDEAEQGRLLFAKFGCNSCHPISGQGRHVAVDLTKLESPLSRDNIRSFVLQPPEGVAMPGYADRLDDDEIRFLVEFCHAVQTFPRRL
jgi:ubiquinol-cytochrome c reductase cytochrome b subunit